MKDDFEYTRSDSLRPVDVGWPDAQFLALEAVAAVDHALGPRFGGSFTTLATTAILFAALTVDQGIRGPEKNPAFILTLLSPVASMFHFEVYLFTDPGTKAPKCKRMTFPTIMLCPRTT